ncbi:MAG: hypothetical protein TU36_006355 [Vulcanisaeta sp. AZ3]|jgi:hypothetical protein|nr:MAG: hypothetical protein TU36_04760 [Vulcanisaeta sp. AZ3]
MNNRRLLKATLITGLLVILIVTQIVTYAQQPGTITNVINNSIRNALKECGVRSAVVITESPNVISKSSIEVIISLSNNYELSLILNLTNGEIPIGGVNITVIANNGKLCYSKYIPIETNISNYDYAIINTNHFIEILSYSGQAPMITNNSRSLVAYGTTINSAVVIPKIVPTAVGNVICTTGTLTPIYMVNLFGRPIMYIIIQLSPTSNKAMLCRFSQSIVISYWLIAALIGISVALIYEAIIIIIKTPRLGIT